MANTTKQTFGRVVGKRRAGSDLAKAIREDGGRRGTGISWNTVKRWITEGLVKRDGTRVVLTDRGFDVVHRKATAARAA